MRQPRQILPYGPTALLLQWEQRIDQAINTSVHAYARASEQIPSVLETVPAYCSLLVTFDPGQVDAYQLREILFALRPAMRETAGKLHRLPVAYGGDYGPDLEEVGESLGLGREQLIQLHCQEEYWVYQVGYQPGFAFLGETLPQLEIARKAIPRRRLAAGSVGLAGRQTGIYPQEAPGGWQIIGRCPWPMLRAEPAPYVRLQAGDRVQFFPITAEDWTTFQQNPDLWTS